MVFVFLHFCLSHGDLDSDLHRKEVCGKGIEEQRSFKHSAVSQMVQSPDGLQPRSLERMAVSKSDWIMTDLEETDHDLGHENRSAAETPCFWP